MKFTYRIEGMHCSACIEKIKLALSPLSFNLLEVTLNPPALKIEAEHTPSINELNEQLATAGNYRVEIVSENKIEQSTVPMSEETLNGLSAYYPIFLIAIYIFGITAINNIHVSNINWLGWMNQFMAGFFLVFSAFKLLDIRGFAEGYATYDLLARHWYPYGFIYPFLELSLGVLYLGAWLPVMTPLLTILIMGFSSLGVINSLLKKQKIQCACLGTILKVPLSTITLVEDVLMVVLAAFALIKM